MKEKKFWESLNDALKSEKVKGLCSFCKSEIKPKIVVGGLQRRDLSYCPRKECGKPIVVCLAPGCENYANGSLMRRPLCHWCFKDSTPKIGSTILKAGSTIASGAATIYIKKKLSDD
tara:strand:- start:127 stop:477 length:351 start_codon:yes stop_codon:yes gene_type:complete